MPFLGWPWPDHVWLQRLLPRAAMQSYEDDVNGDGVNDELHLEMELPLKDTESVQSVSMLLLFDYRLAVSGHCQNPATPASLLGR